ncbi:MAG: sigma-70 family RNA polymerase sigma factor [Myxococcota bacterium]
MVSQSLAAPLAQPLEAAYPVEPLVARCQAGDQAAYRELFTKYQGWVQGCVYHLVRHQADMDDVVQNVFLEVYRSIHRFEGRSKFSTWLTRLAINVALGYRRKLRFWQKTEDAVEEEARSGAVEALRPPAPDEALRDKRTRSAVHRVLQGLSEKKRTVFVLSEIQGLQAPEISEMLGIPPATVRTRLFHARREFETLARKDPVLSGHLALTAKESGG